MTTDDLASNCLRQARMRVRVLPRYLELGGHNIVIREAQEAVELALKAVLRKAGIEPPKWHDVGPILRENAAQFPDAFRSKLDRLLDISRRLRKERELSFYGDVDFLPLENYTREQAEQALAEARKLLAAVEEIFEKC